MPHPHGLIGWVDLTTTDIDAARAFYTELFGWTTEDLPVGPDYSYTQVSKDGRLVAGMGPMAPGTSGMPSMWTSYVIVDDLDLALAKAEAAGGHSLMPAMDVLTQGRQGMVVDPSGAVIGLWQPLDHQGADVFNVPGALTWNELQTRDLDAATTFYAQVFDWRWELSEPSVDYWVGNLDTKSGDDKSNCGAMPTPSNVPAEVPSMWFVYFMVDDCDATLAQATALGGSTLFEPMEMGPGRFAGITDPTGASFMVIAMG